MDVRITAETEALCIITLNLLTKLILQYAISFRIECSRKLPKVTR